MLGSLLLFTFTYITIGFFLSFLGCRYIYDREENHKSGIKEIKSYFLYFWFAWPLFGPLLILEFCDNYNLLDKAIDKFIIGDKKKND